MTDFDWSNYLMPDGESEFPPTFKFENPGDVVAGAITAIREFEKDDEKTPILEIDRNTDQQSTSMVSVFVSQTLLRQHVAEKSPQVGDTIKIEYLGQTVPTKNGRKMKDFEVSVNWKTADPEEDPF